MSTISQNTHKSASKLIFSSTESEELSLPFNRTHEVCGPSRRAFSLMLASLRKGPILWIKSQWYRQNLNAQGIIKFLDPGRITFIETKRTDDILWCMEEILRSGCIPTVIAECDTPPPLTPIRRLHLAAKYGAQINKEKLLPLILTPSNGGAQGIETRWHMSPCHNAISNRWLIERRRARTSPPAAWTLDWQCNEADTVPTAPVRTITTK